MTIAYDGATKVITLSAGTTNLSITDLWSRAVDWWLTGDNSKYQFPFSQVGGDPIDISAGTFIPIYLFQKPDWFIRPQEANHTLTVNEGILLKEGGGDPFTNPIGSFTVRILYQQPVQAITVSIGGSGTTPAQVAEAVWSTDISTMTSGIGLWIKTKLLTVAKFIGLK